MVRELGTLLVAVVIGPPARAANALYCRDLASRAFDALMEHSTS
jgi:hypothetical protein